MSLGLGESNRDAQVPFLHTKVIQWSSLEGSFLASSLSLSVVSPAAWQSATAWTTGAAASGVRPLFSSVTRPVTDRVVPSRSMVPVGLACLVAVMSWSKGGAELTVDFRSGGDLPSVQW